MPDAVAASPHPAPRGMNFPARIAIPQTTMRRRRPRLILPSVWHSSVRVEFHFWLRSSALEVFHPLQTIRSSGWCSSRRLPILLVNPRACNRVETLDESVLSGPARANERQLHALSHYPRFQCRTAELATIVHRDGRRTSSFRLYSLQCLSRFHSRHRAIRFDPAASVGFPSAVGKSVLWTFSRSGFFHSSPTHKLCYRAI